MRVVIWSGGADSTLILYDEMMRNGGQDVIALTLDHPQLGPKAQRQVQRRVQERFKRWLKKQTGMEVRHNTVEVKLSEYATATQGLGQHGLFLCHLFPYVVPEPGSAKNTVLFGYIRGDDFWHHAHRFRSAFEWMASVAHAEAVLEFPLEWVRKPDVVARLDKARIPRDAWWTCEDPKASRPCGKCIKCRSLR